MLVKQIMTESDLTNRQASQAIGISHSSYYYQPKQVTNSLRLLNQQLCQAIVEIVERAPVYGYRKVHAVLRAKGWVVNHKKVLRYLRALDLLQPRKIKGHGFTSPAIVYPESSNSYWEMDLSYVWCGIEHGYLFVIIDGCDRGIPGDNFDERCRAKEAVRALERGVLRRFGGRVPTGYRLRLRVDRGPQFTSREFKEAAMRLGIELEYAGIRCPDDKPYIESFISKYKVEEVYRHEYRSVSEAKINWELYRTWYENERVHQSLKYQTPQKVLEQTQKKALVKV